MKFTIYHKTISTFVFSCLLIVAILLIYFQNNKSFTNASLEAEKSQQIIFQLEYVISLLKDTETGYRGYIITQDDRYLEPYNIAYNKIQVELQTLDSLLKHRAWQQKAAARLRTLIRQREENVAYGLQLAESRDREKITAFISTGQGKRIMDELREQVQRMQQQERNNLKRVSQLAASESENRYLIVVVSMLFMLALSAFDYSRIFKEIRKRQALQQATQHLNQQLQAANKELVASNEALRILQQKVEEDASVLAKRTLELENTNRALLLSSQEVHDLYNNAPCGYHSLDSQGLYIRINDTELTWLGYTREEVIGRMKFSDFLTPESRQAFLENFPRFMAEGKTRDREYEMICKDSNTLPVLLHATAIYNDQGEFVMSRAMFTDHTALKKAKEMILNRTAELEAFSYSVSHDLRSPLRSISGFASILAEEYSGKLDEEGKQVLQKIIHSADTMAQLISDLLEFSLLGRKQLMRTRFNMEEVVQAAIKEVKEYTHTKSLPSMQLQCRADAYADPQLIKQVWINLVSNAVKFTGKKEQPVIKIYCRKRESDTVFVIEDNGIGFKNQYASQIFGVFKRLHSDQEFEGTGAGLAIAKRIIDSHGGDIWAEAEPEKGATIYFTLPDQT
jgi:PAS domain S-box-containing protein